MKKFVFLLTIFLLCFSLSACSSEHTTSEEKETKNAESEDNSIEANDVESRQKAFNFSLEEFAQAYNEKAEEIENDEEMNSPILNRIIFDDIGDFKLAEVKDGTIYTRELINETDESGGTFNLEAWYDDNQNFNCLHLTTFGSDNMASEKGIFNTYAVFQAFGIDIKHLSDLLESDQESLDVIDGDYSVHLAKIPGMSLIINIEPK
ncbi:hypothetical protein P9235_13990 [Bacillus licheniformis]|uniref:hypothetical protein n=1 Tax=Bacillus licheniformis TaxID=1402 RepID=UPI0011A37BD1|nr:hypothetical protein [Bacillus licheniformis]MED4337671.1 hypothetical protein [Bacillus licheniformis]TWK34759.1 hypothetical protein CHCC20369_4253 [Bacillus licheniformis]